ncbi:MAG TPA: hypothetical protein VIB07_03300 [Nitrososphaera sp.]
MKRKDVAMFAGFGTVGAIIIFGTVLLSFSDTPAPFTSDNEILDRANALPEVKAFLVKYPEATAGVHRGSEIEVSYSVSRTNITNAVTFEDRTEPLLFLSVFMHANLEAWQISLYCSSPFDSSDDFGQINDTEITQFLAQSKEEQCFD